MSVAARWIALALLFGGLACEKKSAQVADAARNAAPPSSAAPPTTGATGAASAAIEKVEVPEVRIRAGAATTVRVAWLTPAGTTVNDDAPFHIRWNRSEGLAEAPGDLKTTGKDVKDGFRIKVQPLSGAPNATLNGAIDIVVCDSVTHSVCVPVRRSVELGFVVVQGAAPEATVSIPLPAAK